MTVPGADLPTAVRGATVLDDHAQLAWDSDPDGLATIDADGVVGATNRAFDELIGSQEGATIGRGIGDVFAPEDAAMVLASTADLDSVRVAGIRSDSYPFAADLSTFRSASSDVIILRLDGRFAARAAVDDHLGDDALAHALSHDVRSRLNCVQGFLDHAIDRIAPTSMATAGPYIERAVRAGSAGDRMVAGLVHFLRLRNRAFDLTPTPLGPLVADAAHLATLDLNVELDITVQELPTVLADGPLLREVFVELFRNTVEFARDGVAPAAVVTAEVSRGWCRLSISDNGRGIPPGLADDAFVIFRQLQARNWERGVGVGLAVCRQVLEGHAGTIELDRDEESGTTVRLRLPLAPPS